MTTAVEPRPHTPTIGEGRSPQQVADVFVIFGITGGLAKVMTFQLEHPAPVHPYAKGSWWPDAAEHALAGNGRWHDLWVAS